MQEKKWNGMDILLYGTHTERLLLREHQPGDAADWLPFFQDEEAVRFVGMSGYTDPKEACDAWYARVRDRLENGTGGMNVLIEKHTGKYIGQAGLLVQEVDGQKLLEVGYSLLPEHWGKGFATEAAQHCRDQAFLKGWNGRLHSIIHRDNNASAKVAVKNGMSILWQTDFWGMPVNIYGLDRNTWSALHR